MKSALNRRATPIWDISGNQAFWCEFLEFMALYKASVFLVLWILGNTDVVLMAFITSTMSYKLVLESTETFNISTRTTFEI